MFCKRNHIALPVKFRFLYQFKIWVKAICLHLESFSKINGAWYLELQIQDNRILCYYLLCIMHLPSTVFLLSFVRMDSPLLQQLHTQHPNDIILGHPVKLTV